jgi:hypothetical protein
MVSVERHSVPSAVSCAPQAALSKDTVERSILLADHLHQIAASFGR